MMMALDPVLLLVASFCGLLTLAGPGGLNKETYAACKSNDKPWTAPESHTSRMMAASLRSRRLQL